MEAFRSGARSREPGGPSDSAFPGRRQALVKAPLVSEASGLEAVVQVARRFHEDQTASLFQLIVETDRSICLRCRSCYQARRCHVEIITGRKSILQYLLKPVTRARSEALRER